VEKDARVMHTLRDNLAITGLGGGAQVILGDVEKALHLAVRNQNIFDIIFADPPYRQGLAAGVLNILNICPVLQLNGIIILETGADEDLPVQTGIYQLWRRVKYGDTALSFYQCPVEHAP
jgi:16S rRNA (guanine(966)-N(2))-methyltransferase RsmD